MKLKRLELTNVCLHHHFEIDFEDGLIGFFGPQGSGKTTAVNAAYAALTNDYSRFVGGKTSVPRQQAESHEPSKIVLTAEHAGRPFTLTRILQPTSKHSLTWPGLEKPIVKAGEIDDNLASVLGGSRHLLDKYVFVPQWGLRDLFNLTATDRAKTLSHLCGTTHAEICWDLVGKQLDVDNKLAVTVVDNSDDLRQQIGETRNKRVKVQAELVEADRDSLDEEELAEVQAIVQHEQRIKDAVEQMNTATAQEKLRKKAAVDAVAAHKTATKDRDDLKAQLDQETVNWQHDRDALTAFNAELEKYNEYQRRAKAVKDAEDELAALKPPAKVEYTREEIDAAMSDLNTKLAPHNAVIAQFSELEGLEEGATCPTCGQELDNPMQHLEEAMAAAEPLREEMKTWQRKSGVRSAYDKALQQHEIAKSNAEQRIAERKARLAEKKAIKKPVPPCDAEGVAALKRTRDATQKLYDAACKTHDTKLQAKATAIANHQASKTEIERLGKILAEAKGDAVYEKAQADLAKHNAADKEVTRCETLIEQYDEYLREKEAELENLEHVLLRSANARTWAALLSQVRSVLHRDALPRIVHEAALRRMESGINEMLDTFESPFKVKTSPEDLSYTAYFRNGTIMPAQGLSGGQQVVLALALRWTLNSLFASQIGMMVLDEPTAGLDARHIDLLEVALRGLGEAARARGCQVIIITHERRLEGVFDQVVELERIVT